MYLFVYGISKYCGMNPQEEYKNNLLEFDLQSFLAEHVEYSVPALKKKYPQLYKILASQLAIYPKASLKLPKFTAKYCYLTAKSYEQSSSETAAKYKASLFCGRKIIDLSSGLGIDDIAFSRVFEEVISVDTDAELNLLAELNFKKLGVTNITRITAKAEEYITGIEKADLIYIDSDRRSSGSGKKAVTLHDSSPDITAMLPRLLDISDRVLLKLSPLIDITYLRKSLPHIMDIRVVSVNYEVKEILVTIEKYFTGTPEVIAVNLSAKNKLNSADCNIQQFPGEVKSNTAHIMGTGENYFYEPAPALIKAGLVTDYAESFGLNMLSPAGVYMISDKLHADFFGRAFNIVNNFAFSKSAFKKYLKESNITCANISCRNFPVKPDVIKKQFGITDGGDDYFFFTTGEGKNKLVYHCRKILP